MNTRKFKPYKFYPAFLVIGALIISSCNFPIPTPNPAAPGISDAVLTQAAATILAEIGATQTQQAMFSPTSPATVIPPKPTEPAPTATNAEAAAPPPPQASPSPTAVPPSPTAVPPSPTATFIPVVFPTSTSIPTYVPVEPGFVPTVAITPVSAYYPPAATRIVQMGTHFYVDNVNLSMCYGYYWAVFAISNNGTNNLESLSISVRDLSNGRYLYGPLTDNTPFMWADNTCEAGYLDTLISGGWLFVGGKLNDPAIKYHTLGATIKLCSNENLKGDCFAKNLEFVVP